MRVPEYLDFDLELSTAPGGGYEARVLASPKGEASARFTLPMQGAALENVILKLGRTRSGVRSLSSPQAELARSFGSQLYDSVFVDEVRTCFRRCLDEAEEAGKGLRVRLRVGDDPGLADVPWEFLYAAGLGRFLVLSSETPVVRYLDLAKEVPPLTVAPPLRVLLVVSGPVDLAGLDHEAEVARMKEALSELVAGGFMVVDALPRATLAELRKAMRRNDYHVLHFIGHGGFDPATGGVLAFENDAGRAQFVSGSDLGTLLHDHRTLRLAVLNACEGARQSGTDPFSGVAQSLVRQGLPAVVAMQFEITDDAALTFGQEFYASIADGYPIDAALAQARLAIFASDNDVEWGTPVLYLRAKDGRIFSLPEGSGGAPHRSATTPAPPAPPPVAPPQAAPTQRQPTPRQPPPLQSTQPQTTQPQTSQPPQNTPPQYTPPQSTQPPPTPAQPVPPPPTKKRRLGRTIALAAGAVVVAGFVLAQFVELDGEPGSTATAPTVEPTTDSGERAVPPVLPQPTWVRGAALDISFGSATIDGDFSEWVNDPTFTSAHLVAGRATGVTANWALRWDADALYLLAVVEDASVMTADVQAPAGQWRGDSVSLELGPAAWAEPIARVRAEDAHYIFGVPPQEAEVLDDLSEPIHPAVNRADAARGTFEAGDYDTSITGWVQRTAFGYVVEAAIPWGATGIDLAANERIVALNLNVSDRDVSGALAAMYSTNEHRSAQRQPVPGIWHPGRLVG